MSPPTPPVALSIAGSDSGAGAGVQVDLKTFAALGVYGTSAITALTAQNTVGVRGVVPTPPSFVLDQIEAVLDDFTVRATKTGLLATAGTIAGVAELAAAGRLPKLVVDPVLVNSAGEQIAPEESVAQYRDALLPHALVATPNIHEAALLTGKRVRRRREMIDAAKRLGDSGPDLIVVKGGRLDGDDAVDIVWDGNEIVELLTPRVDTMNNHGTGCTFAAATTAGLALGKTALDAVGAAKEFVQGAIESAADWQLGAGRGPIDHFWRHRYQPPS